MRRKFYLLFLLSYTTLLVIGCNNGSAGNNTTTASQSTQSTSLLTTQSSPLACPSSYPYSFYNRTFSYTGSDLTNVLLQFNGIDISSADGNVLCTPSSCNRNNTVSISPRETIPVTYCNLALYLGSSITDAYINVPNVAGNPSFSVSTTDQASNPYMYINGTSKPVSIGSTGVDSNHNSAIIEVTANYNNNGHAGSIQVNDTVRKYYVNQYHNYTDIPFNDANSTAQFIFKPGSSHIGSACNSSPECNNDQTYANYPQIGMAANTSIDVGYNFFQGIINGAPENPDQYSSHLYIDGRISLQAKQADGTSKTITSWSISPNSDTTSVTLNGSNVVNTSVRNSSGVYESITIAANCPTQGAISVYSGYTTCMNSYNKVIINKTDIPFVDHQEVPLKYQAISPSAVCVPVPNEFNFCAEGASSLPVAAYTTAKIMYVMDAKNPNVTVGNITYWSTAVQPPGGQVNFKVAYDSISKEPKINSGLVTIPIMNMQMKIEDVTFVPNCPNNGDITIYLGKPIACQN